VLTGSSKYNDNEAATAGLLLVRAGVLLVRIEEWPYRPASQLATAHRRAAA
jgi:hypothetical protein